MLFICRRVPGRLPIQQLEEMGQPITQDQRGNPSEARTIQQVRESDENLCYEVCDVLGNDEYHTVSWFGIKVLEKNLFTFLHTVNYGTILELKVFNFEIRTGQYGIPVYL